jgi:hypothetical protein
MENFVWLFALACPIGMFLMMWLMGRGMRSGHKNEQAKAGLSVDELRSEQQRLGGEIKKLERSNGEKAGEEAAARIER